MSFKIAQINGRTKCSAFLVIFQTQMQFITLVDFMMQVVYRLSYLRCTVAIAILKTPELFFYEIVLNNVLILKLLSMMVCFRLYRQWTTSLRSMWYFNSFDVISQFRNKFTFVMTKTELIDFILSFPVCLYVLSIFIVEKIQT